MVEKLKKYRMFRQMGSGGDTTECRMEESPYGEFFKVKDVEALLSASDNNRYATALEVVNEFEQEPSSVRNNITFPDWCKQRLNADDSTSHS